MAKANQEKQGQIALSDERIRALAEAEKILSRPYEYNDCVAQARVNWEQAVESSVKAVKKAFEVGGALKVIIDIEGDNEIFGETCKRVGMPERKARDLIAQYSVWRLEPPPALANVGSSKMIDLTYMVDRLTDEERDALINEGRLGSEDVNEMGHRAVRRFKTELIKRDKQIAEMQKDKSDGAKYVKLLEEKVRRLEAATPEEEEDLLKYLEGVFEDIERICSKLTEVKLNDIGQRGLLRYASCLEFMRTRPARVLEKQALTTPELAELDIIAPYTEIQNAIITERSVMAQRDPKKAKQLESVSPLTNALDELEPSPSN